MSKKLFFHREVSRTPATFKMVLFVTLLNDFQPLNNVTKYSILNAVIFRSTFAQDNASVKMGSEFCEFCHYF